MADDFTVTLKEDPVLGAKCAHGYKMLTGSLLFSASYPNTGGWAVSGEAMDLSKIFPKDLHIVLVEYYEGYKFTYDYTNKRIHVFIGAAGADAEVANNEDLHDKIIDARFIAIGK